MISNISRRLLVATAVVFGLLGLALFLAPAWSAANFSWKISPMVAMSMGGWCLGNAFTAGHTALRGRTSIVYPGLIYLLTFGVLEVLVLVVFRDRLVLAALLAWPYILALVLAILGGGLGLLDWQRQGWETEKSGPPVSGLIRGLAVLFVLFVGALAVIGVSAQAGSFATEGQIFPEPLTLFTLRAFAAFYASLTLPIIPLIWARSLKPILFQGWNGLVLIITITAAALVNLDKFDFADRPGGLMYLGAYLVAAVVIIPILALGRQSVASYEIQGV